MMIKKWKRKIGVGILSLVLSISVLSVNNQLVANGGQTVSEQVTSESQTVEGQLLGDKSVFTDVETQVVNGISEEFIIDKIEYVHNNIGPRLAGTPADESSAKYFAKVFKELGYKQFSLATASDGEDDYFETITNNDRVNSYIGASLTIDGREYAATAPHWSEEGAYKGYKTKELIGDTVYFETVEEALEADKDEIAHKIVLTNKKDLTEWNKKSTAYADVVRSLEANGAAAVVFIHNKYTVSESGATSKENELPAIVDGEPIYIPVIQITYLDGKDILKKLTHHGGVHSTEATIVNRKNTHTSNVLAVKEASKPSDKYVIVGGHRDSVLGGEGVDDNLSGTVNVLAIANALKDIDTDYNVIFALWGAEETGLVGSKYFYSEFLYPENWGKEHVLAYYNLDMAATSQTRNSVLTIHTPYKDADGNPLQSLAGDAVEYNAVRYKDFIGDKYDAWWTQGPEDWVDLQYFGNCSDHAAITGATGANGTPKTAFGEGIPAVYTFWGDRRGDDINNVTEENYHVVGDIYQWPSTEDEFTVISDDHVFTGNYSIERATILASIYAVTVFDTATGAIDYLRPVDEVATTEAESDEVTNATVQGGDTTVEVTTSAGESASSTETTSASDSASSTETTSASDSASKTETTAVATESGASSAKKVKKPAKVSIKSAKKKSAKKIVVKINKVKKAVGYQVEVKSAKKVIIKKFIAKNVSNLLIKSKKIKGKKVVVRVRAYVLDGKKKVYGAWSKVKVIK